MLERVKQVWSQHGTKLIGAGSALVGTLTLIDHETADKIGETLGPVWGPRVKHALWIGAGIGTAYRGFTNSRRP